LGWCEESWRFEAKAPSRTAGAGWRWRGGRLVAHSKAPSDSLRLVLLHRVAHLHDVSYQTDHIASPSVNFLHCACSIAVRWMPAQVGVVGLGAGSLPMYSLRVRDLTIDKQCWAILLWRARGCNHRKRDGIRNNSSTAHRRTRPLRRLAYAR